MWLSFSLGSGKCPSKLGALESAKLLNAFFRETLILPVHNAACSLPHCLPDALCLWVTLDSGPARHNGNHRTQTRARSSCWAAEAMERWPPGFEGHYQRYAIYAELKLLTEQDIPGMYVVPQPSSLFVWDATLFLRAGLYRSAVLKLQLVIPEDFPSATVPQVFFVSNIQHPLIDPRTHLLDLSGKFKLWRHDRDRLWEIFDYVRRVFLKPQAAVGAATDADNADMAVGGEDDDNAVPAVAAASTSSVQDSIHQCLMDIYTDGPDEFGIRFSKWDDGKHGHILHDITSREEPQSPLRRPGFATNAQSSGLSWVKDGVSFGSASLSKRRL
eukprot:m.285127 g.285127  ORF g.285127 m.285127 type:complete len:329 (+) comp11305_c0_seq1:546-1532(+)